jgi:tripartite-type tricarboxylate transporter receptor subunit TctC
MLSTIGRMQARAIPYKGTPGALTDLAGGLLDFMIVDYPASRPFLDSGRIRPLGTTGRRRLPTLPHLPSLHEVPDLAGYELVAWLGLLAPKGTPASAVVRLNQALRDVLKVPSVRERLQAMGTEVTPGSPREFAVFMREQTRIWRDRIAEAGITPE